MKRFLLAAALLTLGLGQGQAAPADVITALQGKQPTLLELAMARLEAAVQSAGLAGGYSAWVWQDQGEIFIDVWRLEPGDEAACKALIEAIQTRAGVDPTTGFPWEPASAFASYFSFPGSIDEFAVDPSYMETVDSMFTVRVVLGISGDGQAQLCKSKLLSTEIEYSKD